MRLDYCILQVVILLLLQEVGCVEWAASTATNSSTSTTSTTSTTIRVWDEGCLELLESSQK